MCNLFYRKSKTAIKSKMNFNFSLNETFPGSHNILKIGHDLLPENCHAFTGRNFHLLQQVNQPFSSKFHHKMAKDDLFLV